MSEPSLIAEWQRVTHQLLHALDDAVRELGLSPGELNALVCFGDEDTISVRALVAATGQRASTITGVLDRLERRGLLGRRAHPQDRRALEVALTPEGRRYAAEVSRVLADFESRLPAQRVRAALRAVEAALP